MKKALNARQERFCEFVAAGESQTDAYLKAGFKVSPDVAKANASRLLANANVQTRLTELRNENRQLARKTKEEKLARLEEIAWDKCAKHSDVISALRTHNEMTGDNEPTISVIETAPSPLESIQERAKRVSSVTGSSVATSWSSSKTARTVPHTGPASWTPWRSA